MILPDKPAVLSDVLNAQAPQHTHGLTYTSLLAGTILYPSSICATHRSSSTLLLTHTLIIRKPIAFFVKWPTYSPIRASVCSSFSLSTHALILHTPVLVYS
jgi:hypothetical protein